MTRARALALLPLLAGIALTGCSGDPQENYCEAVAEHQGVRMPGFFGYLLWSFGILLPLFVLVTVLFLR